MSLSFGSVFMCILISFFIYIYFLFILYVKSKNYIGHIRFVFAGVILLCMRALLPFNFPFTVTIPIEYGLIGISDFLLLTEIRGYSLIQVFILVWVLGFFLKFLRLIWKYSKFRKIINQAASINHFRKKQISDILSKYNKDDNIKIAILPNYMSPAISGVLNPVLLMPDYDFTTEDLHYIISHEVTHHKKHDLILKLFFEICTCIYWWNPIMYLVKSKFFLAIEIANDFLVIKGKSYNYQMNYIKCLVLNSKLYNDKKTTTRSNVFEIPFIKNNTNIKIRVEKILNYSNVRSFGVFSLFSKCALFVILLFGVIVVPETYYVTPDCKTLHFLLMNIILILLKRLGVMIYL